MKLLNKSSNLRQTNIINIKNSLQETNNPSFPNETPVHKKHGIQITLLFFILLLSSLALYIIAENTVNAKEVQEGISNEIIRFHVIANSDSEEDQTLKYKVKEALVAELSLYLKDASSVAEARNILSRQLSSIQTLAETVINQNGYSYPVSVSLEPWYFPIKMYGNYTFPPGTYAALRVQIGEAKGQNWWCVMFPPLCFVDETYSIVDEDTDQQLKYLLTEEEYETLRSRKIPVKVKFKLWNSIKKWFD
jgi:stage II sporulation protein R